MVEDPALLPALRRRAPEAFQELFELYSHKLFRLTVGMCGRDEDAEDVVQETFLRFIEVLDRFEGRSAIGTWLYRVAHNACIDRLRRQHPTLELVEEDLEGEDLPLPALLADWDNLPEDVYSRAEFQGEMRAAIAELPPRLRAAFLLRDVEELSTEEAARVLEIEPGAVKVRLHRARLLLRERLSRYVAGQAA